MSKSKTIVFIHGLFVNPDSWVEWKTYFEAQGYKCYTSSKFTFAKSGLICFLKVVGFPSWQGFAGV